MLGAVIGGLKENQNVDHSLEKPGVCTKAYIAPCRDSSKFWGSVITVGYGGSFQKVAPRQDNSFFQNY